MSEGRRRRGRGPAPSELLSARIAELELRVKLLEAKVRQQVAASADKGARPAQAKAPRSARKRPRCPGCLLELPPGRRKDSCVWCGFVFNAVSQAKAR